MNKKTVLMLVVAMSVGAFTQTAVAQAAATSPAPVAGPSAHPEAKAVASHVYAHVVPEEESVKR